MPKYTVKDKNTGKTVTFNWNEEQPPTDTDMEEVFAASRDFAPQEQPVDQTQGADFIGAMSPDLPEQPPYSLEDTEPYGRPLMEYGGLTAGGIAGSGAGPAGTIGGAGLGYGIGKKAADLFYGKSQGTIGEEILGSAVDVSQGAAMEMGGGALGALATKVGKPTAIKIYDTVRKGIEKSIRPGVALQRTAKQAEQYFKRATDAVTNIILNKNNLKLTDESGKAVTGLPKTLKQFSEAVGQTKKIVFQRYDDLAKTATSENIRVKLGSAISELESALTKPLKDVAPTTAKYIKQRIDMLVKRNSPTIKYAKQHGVQKTPIEEIPGGYTASEAQDAIMHLNRSLDAFYKNPTYETATKAYVDSLVVNHLRKNLGDAITQATGSSYQSLKNIYGALSHIERDVARRAAVDARKNIKGLIDFSDILSGAELAHGIVSMSPGFIAKGVTAKAIASAYRYINNPNRLVKNMFSEVEKMLTKQTIAAEKTIASSATGRALGRTATYGSTMLNGNQK